jgi:gliding motility-associated-like protein
MGTGNIFSTPTITKTTTYYVDATENDCTSSSRTPVSVNVEYTDIPAANTSQTFCENENATIINLTITGENIKWYASPSGGSSLDNSEKLISKTYYASQTFNGCESTARLGVQVTVFEVADPKASSEISNLTVCDDELDGDGTNGISSIDLTTNAATILNGQSAADFSLAYFEDANYFDEITNPSTFVNTISYEQTIYVRMSNNLDPTCYTDTSFEIEVFALPEIVSQIVLKNCDEDGIPDGFADFNLDQANDIITYGNTGLVVTYYLSFSEANTNSNPIDPSPFNNINGGMVYARVENLNGCYRIGSVSLQVATTSFPAGYVQELQTCDKDDVNDGLFSFDLTQASTDFISQFPTGQNLSVHYYRNLTDAQLEQDEILTQDNYINETPYSQQLYVRVESMDNGDCYGIGQHLNLTVNPRPTFTTQQSVVVCLNLGPIFLEILNPQGDYTYQWMDETGIVISNEATASISSGGNYTVIATSELNCESFPQTVHVIQSVIADIEMDDVTIVENSANNTISINNDNNNLGEGDYVYALDDSLGDYQEEPFFEMVIPGIHTVYVKDKYNCGIAQLEVFVLGFPKFFTPNNDGFNDRWQIKGLDETDVRISSIYIFDRFGKVLSQIDPKGDGWDGIFNGNPLPAEDYWYSVELLGQDGNVRNLKGHFSLIR